MKDIDLIQIWKEGNKKRPSANRYSLDEIHQYRLKKSWNTRRSSRWSILFDIVFKTIVIIEYAFLIALLENQNFYQLISGLLLSLTAILILFDLHFLKKLNGIRESASVMQNLKTKLIYLKSTNHPFLIVSALTNPLFVLAGFFLYYYYKYGEIHLVSPFQDPVLYLFLLIAFAISYFAQRPVYQKQQSELKESIYDMDDPEEAYLKIKTSETRKKRNAIVFSILIILGLVVLILLLRQYWI